MLLVLAIPFGIFFGLYILAGGDETMGRFAKRLLQIGSVLTLMFMFASPSKAQSSSEMIYNCVIDSEANGLPYSLAEPGCYFEVYMGEGLDSATALMNDLLDGMIGSGGGFEAGSEMEYDPYAEYVHPFVCADCNTDAPD